MYFQSNHIFLLSKFSNNIFFSSSQAVSFFPRTYANKHQAESSPRVQDQFYQKRNILQVEHKRKFYNYENRI